jgi:hypothetical protein
VAIKRAGKEVARFEDYHLQIGNATDFALLSLSGREEKQLVVTQSGPRWWVHWIVDLSSEPRVVFFSKDYDVSREMGVVDIDGDGVKELTQAVMHFDYFYGLPHSLSPLPRVIFKYDPQARKYIPANREFADWLLGGVEKEKEGAEEVSQRALSAPGHSNDHYNYIAAMLDVMLRYIYAGREVEAWAFFDEHYVLKDKKALKSKIEEVLAGCQVYKIIYGR